MTGAIVGLRFKGEGGAGSGSSGGGSGGSGSGDGDAMAGAGSSSSSRSSSRSPWGRLLSKLRLPGSWLAAGRSGGRSGGSSAPAPKSVPALSNASWASFNAPLALPVYSTYSEDDYDTIWDSYAWQGRDNLADWFYRDFGKPNATGGHSRRGGRGGSWGGLAGRNACTALCCTVARVLDLAVIPAGCLEPRVSLFCDPSPFPPWACLQSRAGRGGPSICLRHRRCGGGAPMRAACTLW